MSEEMKPCPFCGGEASIDRYGNSKVSTQYSCGDCGCTLETCEEWDHGERWNQRKCQHAEIIAQQAERINELEGALKQAQLALEICYDVVDYPCNGSTRQDEAIKLAVKILAKGGE